MYSYSKKSKKKKKKKEMKLWETLLNVILLYTLYICMDKGGEKKTNPKTLFTLSDTGIHFVFTLITSFRHGAIDSSLRRKNLADRKL